MSEATTKAHMQKLIVQGREWRKQDYKVEQAFRRVMQALSIGCSKYPKWQYIFTRWHVIPVTDTECTTMYTTGPHLAFNPAFVEKQGNLETLTTIIHEAAHVFLNHMKGMRHLFKEDHNTANQAADLAIHGLWPKLFKPLAGKGFCFPGEGSFAALPNGRSAEWYYEKLKKQQEEQQQQQQQQQQQEAGDGDEEKAGGDWGDGDNEEGDGDEEEAGGDGGDSDNEEGDGDDGGDGHTDANDTQAGSSGVPHAETEGEDGGTGTNQTEGSGSDGDETSGDSGQAEGSKQGADTADGDDNGQYDRHDGPNKPDGTGVVPKSVQQGSAPTNQGGRAYTEDVGGGVRPMQDWDYNQDSVEITERCGQMTRDAENYDPCDPMSGTEVDPEESDLVPRLRSMIKSQLREGVSYQRPRRRGYNDEMCLPCNREMKLGTIAVLIDVSYSMSNVNVMAGYAHVQNVLEEMPDASIMVYQASTSLIPDATIEADKDNPLTEDRIVRKGSGSTRLQDAMTDIQKECQPSVIVVWSDMIWNVRDSKDPGTPVLWAMVHPEEGMSKKYSDRFWNENQFPFGERVITTKRESGI